VLWFVHIGDTFLHDANSSAAIDSVHTSQSQSGYDGQFYFFIGADPARAHDYMHDSVDGNQSGIRYARILYPLIARVVSAGRVGALPYAMLAINLLAIGAGTLAVALWLRRRGRSPWFAALYGLWPGMVFSVFRDLSEPLAYGLAALAMLVFDPRKPRRVWGACALIALALLCRETVLAFAVAGAVALWLQDRRPGRAAAFVVGSVGPMAVWRLIVTHWLHVTTFESTGGGHVLVPFYAMSFWWPWNNQHWLILLTIDLPLLLAAAGGIVLLHRRRSLPEAVLLLLNAALLIVFVPSIVEVDYGAAGRNAVPVLLGALYCLPAWPNRVALAGLALMLSPLWFVLAARLLGIPPLDVTI
jgi:hypothetical protein